MSRVKRITTHGLAEAMLAKPDESLAVMLIGKVAVVWDDKGGKQAMTSIKTEDFFAPDEREADR